jgi:hypothetical protein
MLFVVICIKLFSIICAAGASGFAEYFSVFHLQLPAADCLLKVGY